MLDAGGARLEMAIVGRFTSGFCLAGVFIKGLFEKAGSRKT